MSKEFAKSFYNSKAWQECRAAFIKSVFGLCKNHSVCRRPGVIVHHKTRLTPENINDPDVTLNWDNLELLCIECHNAVDKNTEVTRDDIMFTPDGQVALCKHHPCDDRPPPLQSPPFGEARPGGHVQKPHGLRT